MTDEERKEYFNKHKNKNKDHHPDHINANNKK
jgi:hypothetical protein